MPDTHLAPSITPARRAGLAVLWRGQLEDRPVYESNHTTQPGQEPGSTWGAARDDRTALRLYWQTVQWALGLGLVRVRATAAGKLVTLTPEGRQLAMAEGQTCANCHKPIRLAPAHTPPGATEPTEPYWYHPHDGHGSVWCSGWGDPAGTGQQAEPWQPPPADTADTAAQEGRLL